jgi:hypothetical protein
MMDIKTLPLILKSKLNGFNFKVVNSGTSIYIHFDNCNVKQIRVSNHNGRKTSGKCFELRTDAMNNLKAGIFNFKNVNNLVSLIKQGQ